MKKENLHSKVEIPYDLRVMCVNKENWMLAGRLIKGPAFGEICTVTRIIEDNGGLFYGLKEWDDDYADWAGSVFFRLQGER
ncbi:hypothetical protein [Agriterribacter sp.]|uniref:hypothetical protein n=1 Tax=Agriterribacter sp. TaxID=2821509 RepID=UPI002C3B656B|nr:hypothetical protein [Agriterribacter sp.]HTN09228.1 hypothetical protein [Agriterribacter sp.]